MDRKLTAALSMSDMDTAAKLIDSFRPRLKALVRLRMSPQLSTRVDDSDVAQEAISAAVANLSKFDHKSHSSVYLWVRAITLNKLAEATRHHLTVHKRSVHKEEAETLDQEESSIWLANRLVSDLSSPSSQAIKSELIEKTRCGLDAIEATDREMLILTHYEGMSLAEAAQVVGLSKSGAGKRYLRAIKSLRYVLESLDDASKNTN